MQTCTLLGEQLAENRELQKVQHQRLAGIVQGGSIVAVRHSDHGSLKYLYYLGKVSKVSPALAWSSPISKAGGTAASAPTSASRGIMVTS